MVATGAGSAWTLKEAVPPSCTAAVVVTILTSGVVCACAPGREHRQQGQGEQRGGKDRAQPADGETRACGNDALRGRRIEAVGSIGAGEISGGAGRFRREANGPKRSHREDASWATRRPRRPGDPATRRPGDPATRRPGDPATRRPGDPATRRPGRPGDPATRRPGDPATRRPGDPATRRPGDPATRRPGDPATIIAVATSPFVNPDLPIAATAAENAAQALFTYPIMALSLLCRGGGAPQGCRTPSIARWFPPSTTAAPPQGKRLNRALSARARHGVEFAGSAPG